MAVLIVLRILDAEVWLPSQFTDHISLKAHLRTVRETSAFNFVILIGIKLAFGCVRDRRLILEWLVKELLQTIKC